MFLGLVLRERSRLTLLPYVQALLTLYILCTLLFLLQRLNVFPL
jgi:hypothetical protein